MGASISLPKIRNPMTEMRFWSIVLTVALFNVLRVYWAKYQYWKANRKVIPTARNWRGLYEPDLTLKRIERSIVWAFVLLFAVCFLISCWLLSGLDLIYLSTGYRAF